MVVRADTGAIAQAISYDEFGRVLSDSNPGFQAFGFAGRDTNLYGYVLNDPINLVDPSGLWGVQIGVSVGGIFPAMGAGGEAGIAMTYSANSGFQLGGYTSGHAKARAGIFGGFGLGGLGAVYGTVGYTSTSTWFSSGSPSMCGAH